MKRIICAFLVAVLCMNLYVPALAVEEVPDYEVGTFYWDDSDGNTYTTVKSVEPDGTYKVTVSGISGTTEAVRKGDIVDFTSITPEVRSTSGVLICLPAKPNPLMRVTTI